MTDDQLIVLAAAILRAAGKDQESAVVESRALLAQHRLLGPPTQTLPETRKAVLTKPTIQDRNEAYQERQYGKKHGI